MTARFGLHDPQDSSNLLEGFLDTQYFQFGALESSTSSEANASKYGASPIAPVRLPAETYEAEAAVSASGLVGSGSVVAETSGGLTIDLIFDAAAMAAPAAFRAGIEQAAATLSSSISDKITLNFQIDYSGTGGGGAAGPDNGEWLSYSTVRTDLINNASPGDTTFNALPAGSTIQGQSSVVVWNAQLKLWGLLGANDTTTDDGSATFATDINPSLLVGVALHELTHAMGRVPYGAQPDVFDLYRFTSPGVRLFTDNIPASAAYFSLDGGNTKLADYGQNSDPSDFLNSGVQGGNDPFNEYYSESTLQQLTAIDLKQLDALGFHLATGSALPTVDQTQAHPNDLNYASTASGYNHFIDLSNFEASFPDLIAAFGTNQSAMQNWFNQYEPTEKRVASFDGLDYIASYPDLTQAFANAGSMAAVEDAGAQHYIQHGLNEDRQTSFNGLDYIASYKDLISAFGANGDAGAFHFIEDGASEHRTITFDGLDYIASYPDLILAFGANEQAGAVHYIDHGSYEQRTTTFDWFSYIAQYPDLMKAFGANNDAGAAHYIDHGYAEGRTTSFNVAAYEQAHPDLIGLYATNDQFLTAYINHYVTTGHFLT